MKKIFYIVLLFYIWGCTSNDITVYQQDRNSIQFDYKPENMSLNYDFAFQYKKLNQRDKYYYGDSLRTDTFRLAVTILGFQGDSDQTFRLKAVPVEGQDSTRLAEVEFEPYYTFRKNGLHDTVQFVLHRPEKRGLYTIGVTFEVNDSTRFDLGVEEKNTYRINLSDVYPRPDNWDACKPWLGDYTEEKYAFYVTVLNQVFDPYYWLYSGDRYSYAPRLKQALKEYNAAHPDAPKDFSFPE